MPVATLGLGCLLYFIHTGKRLSDRVNQLTLKADFAARRQKSTGKAAEWDRGAEDCTFFAMRPSSGAEWLAYRAARSA